LLLLILGLVKLLSGGPNRLDGLPLLVVELIRLEQALNDGLLFLIVTLIIVIIL
jgi:hypothetical protein